MPRVAPKKRFLLSPYSLHQSHQTGEPCVCTLMQSLWAPGRRPQVAHRGEPPKHSAILIKIFFGPNLTPTHEEAQWNPWTSQLRSWTLEDHLYTHPNPNPADFRSSQEPSEVLAMPGHAPLLPHHRKPAEDHHLSRFPRCSLVSRWHWLLAPMTSIIPTLALAVSSYDFHPFPPSSGSATILLGLHIYRVQPG